MPMYPREDKCRFCGDHLGYIMHPMGEMLALGLCEKQECQIKAMKQDKHPKGGKNGSESDKGK